MLLNTYTIALHILLRHRIYTFIANNQKRWFLMKINRKTSLDCCRLQAVCYGYRNDIVRECFSIKLFVKFSYQITKKFHINT